MEKKTRYIPTKRETFIHFVKFVAYSLSAGIIQFGSNTLFFEVFKMDSGTSYFISLVLSVLWNFTINRKFNFKSALNVPQAMFLVACYYVVFTPASLWWVVYFENIGWNHYVVLIGTMLINFVTEFLFQRFVVYRNHINSALDSNKKA